VAAQAIVRDITTRKLAEERLQRTKSGLNQRSGSRTSASSTTTI
jgi:hypothetical protein